MRTMLITAGPWPGSPVRWRLVHLANEQEIVMVRAFLIDPENGAMRCQFRVYMADRL